MNTNIKTLLAFILGAGVGSLLTYQTLNARHEQELEDQFNALVDEFELQEDLTTSPYPKVHTGDIFTVENTEEVYKEITHNYNKLYKPSLDEVVEEKIAQHPYLIDVNDFNSLRSDIINDKVSLTYYQDDDVLIDEDEEIITNVYDIIGNEALTSFGKYSADPDIVYVRNDRLGIDYEIVRLYKSYQVTVLGMKEEEPPRKKVKNGTKAKE